MISQESIKESVNKEFSDVEVRFDLDNRVSVIVQPNQVVDVANYLKHEMGFVHPNMCTGIDRKDSMEVLWHIGNPETNILVVLRASLDRDSPKVSSLTNVWKGFDWHEREAYDMLGIDFLDHPDLRRILMPEGWEGYPLREDYIYRKPNYRKLEDQEEN